MQQGEVVVRAARAADWPARAELVRASIAECDFEAFILFFFQELTLQVCVLCGAILFIFAGASLWACAALAPAAAALVAVAVAVAHRALGDSHAQRLRTECLGLVAEYRGPLAADARSLRVAVRVLAEGEAGEERRGRVVGTVSASEHWGPRHSAWLHELAVDKQWRRRGLGAALVRAACARCGARGQESVEALVSHVQPGARALLHRLQWQLRGTYSRPVCAVLALPVAALGLELPAPAHPRPLGAGAFP